MFINLTINVCVMYNKLYLPGYTLSTQLSITQSTF